jgi:uncharacterized alpha-E superfamily protein
MTLRNQTTMLSRVADSLYWMSRYLERAEHTARLIDVDLQLQLEQSPEADAARSLRLLAASHVETLAAAQDDSISLSHLLTFDRANPSSIVSCLAFARENLRQVREQCSSEMWEQLNRLYLKTVNKTGAESMNPHGFYRAVQEGAHLFQGITDATMSHGQGWHYIQLGRYVERTDALATVIGTHFSFLPHYVNQTVESEEYLEWVGLLKSCSAFEAYCKAYTAELRPLRVAEFLLLNPELPHSVLFSIEQIYAALLAIAQMTDRRADEAIRLMGRLRATLGYSHIEEIMANGATNYMNGVRAQCAQVHLAIHQIYFDYPVESALVA